MQQNQRFQWSVMSRLYLTMIVFELLFELGNLPTKSMRSPEKNLVPSSHFLPLWNISIAEVVHAKKRYEMLHIILIFFWAPDVLIQAYFRLRNAFGLTGTSYTTDGKRMTGESEHWDARKFWKWNEWLLASLGHPLLSYNNHIPPSFVIFSS